MVELCSVCIRNIENEKCLRCEKNLGKEKAVMCTRGEGHFCLECWSFLIIDTKRSKK